MTEFKGIIDEERNPFVKKSWIEQNYPFTPDRADDVAKLFGLTVKEIKVEGNNKGTYPAFVAIRREFAEMVNGRLEPTKRYEEREKYFE